ncbi:MAG: ATP-binding protein [Acidimicrobiia bacterium]|nr:ATP-binding protein [Acidimicrobiia bacterium]
MKEFAVATNVYAAAKARATVADWIPGHPRLDDVKHVLSELINNVVVHGRLPGGSRLVVRMLENRDQLRFEVVYPNTNETRHSRPQRVQSSRGYGLRIVDQLVDEWGVEASPDRVIDWFEIELRTFQDH